MAKKVTRERETGTQTPETIRAVIFRLKSLTAGLESAAQEMERHKVASLEVKYQKAIKRFFKEMNRWTGAVQDALSDALDEAGVFRADPKVEAEAGPDAGPARRRKRPQSGG